MPKHKKDNIISVVRVGNVIMRREELLKQHTNKIWKSKNGQYCTYLPGRKLRYRPTLEQLEDVLIKYYVDKLGNPTFEELFHIWLDRKHKRGEISNATKDRYNREYKRCFETFGKRKIRDIQTYEIEDFLLDTVTDYGLDNKRFSQNKMIVREVFLYAQKRDMIDFRINEVLEDMSYSNRIFRKRRKEDDELVFMTDELQKILKYFADNAGSLTIVELGIALDFCTGMRCGELAALKREDVENNVIHVNRTETKYEGADGKDIYEVKNSPKTEAGFRNVVVPEEGMWILEKILNMNPGSEYLFEHNGRRYTSASFDKKIRTICGRLGIKKKSMNKVRKTYATILIDKGVSDSIIIAQMGHTDIKTTREYYYKNIHRLKEQAEQINLAFSGIKKASVA